MTESRSLCTNAGIAGTKIGLPEGPVGYAEQSRRRARWWWRSGGFVAWFLWSVCLVELLKPVEAVKEQEWGKGSAKGKGKEARTRADVQPTGRRVQPSGRGDGREGGGADDPRRAAPGVLDEGKGKAGRKVGGGKGKNLEDNSTEGARETEAKGKGAGAGDTMPPEREFVRPTRTREALVREVEALDRQIATATANGQSLGAITLLRKQREEIEKDVKAAGGRTRRTLLFSIKTEEEMQEKSAAMVERCKERIREREEQIRDIQDGIRMDMALLERHKQREQAASQRLAFLAVQKVGESLPAEFVEKVRIAASIIKDANDDRLGPVDELLSAMLPTAQEFNIGEDDSNSTVPGMDAGGGGHDEDINLFEEERHQEMTVARSRLVEEQRKLEQAIEGALRSKQCKRRSGEDDAKEARDEEMPEEEVATLSPEQTADLYRQRIKEAEADLARLEGGSRKEVIPVIKCSTAGGAEEGERKAQGGAGEGSNKWSRVGRSARRSRWSDEDEPEQEEEKSEGGKGRGTGGGEESRAVGQRKAPLAIAQHAAVEGSQEENAQAGEPMELEQWRGEGAQSVEGDEEARRLREEIRRNNEANQEMAQQERLQQQQEKERREELQVVEKLGKVRAAAAEVEKRRIKPY